MKTKKKPAPKKPRTSTVKVTLQLPWDLAEYYEHIRDEEGKRETFEAAIIEHMRKTIADYFEHIEYQQNPKHGRLSEAFNNFLFDNIPTKKRQREIVRILGMDRWPWTGTKPKSFQAAKVAAARRGRAKYKRFARHTTTVQGGAK